MSSSGLVAPLVQGFFVEHLLRHKCASPQTISAYRDTLRLLFGFVRQTTGKQPTALLVADLGVPVILAFLDHLEEQRKNGVRSRNARLAAIRSFFRYVALSDPESLDVATRVLAIPIKRTDRRLIGYLTRQEIDALLSAPDHATWTGRRDHALLLTLYNTGARVSEIAALRCSQVVVGTNTSIRLHGKGRKDRAVPIWSRTARVLRAWFHELGEAADRYVFPNTRGGPLTRHGIAYILDQTVERARRNCPSLAQKQVTPHVLRHTTAMHLLQAGVDVTVIALWLGHENMQTTHCYIEADLTMKERALRTLQPAGHGPPGRFKPDDDLMHFLATL
jgi:integrase/recombinase XerD